VTLTKAVSNPAFSILNDVGVNESPEHVELPEAIVGVHVPLEAVIVAPEMPVPELFKTPNVKSAAVGAADIDRTTILTDVEVPAVIDTVAKPLSPSLLADTKYCPTARPVFVQTLETTVHGSPLIVTTGAVTGLSV
jgi:hypothetical protein